MLTITSSVASFQRSRIQWAPLPRRANDSAPVARHGKDGGALVTIDGLPDLLHVDPRFMIDADALSNQLAFSFAGGDAADGIRRVLAEVATAPSDWTPESFARHLFVDELIRTACKLELDGRAIEVDTAAIGRLLTRPPNDPQIRDFRHAILAELASSDETRAALTELYRRLLKVRRLFLSTAPPKRWEATRHRLDVLESIRAALEAMGHGLDRSTSGLARIGSFAKVALASDEFAHLRDLLEHDRERANATIQLRLGGDGRVRAVTIQKLAEESNNRFHFGPIQRLLMKLKLWVRGYRFSDESLVDHWIDTVYAGIERWLPVLFQMIGQLELYLCALAFRDRARERGLEVCIPTFHDQPESKLEKLFNPLLFAQNITPVPCDLLRSGPGKTTIITGPNSGGKTRVLQAIGLSQLLGQTGFFVPAASAQLRRVPVLFCSLVQEDSFDQSEGRLGTELLRIRRLFEEARPGALVVLDELCSGTNPSEGEEIFMLVISLLHELRPETFVTSHFLDFASRLAKHEGMELEFLQVELDDKERPTYGFVPGVARTSLAARAAARLGVTREELLALVQKHRPE